MRMRGVIPWGVGGRATQISTLLIVLAAAGSCGGGRDQRSGVVAVGREVPAYAATTLDGTPVSLAQHRGEVVLLNIWATWCKPCREEIPALETLHKAYAARGLLVAGVSIDAHDDTASIAGFARDLGATYPLWHDQDDRISTTFLAIGVPNTYLIDRAGVLRWRHVGAVKADDPVLLAALDSALNASADSAGSGRLVDRQ